MTPEFQFADQTDSGTLSWRLQGERRPCVTLTVRVAEAARARTIREQIRRTGTQILPDCLHGPDAARQGLPHRHVFWLPEDRDGDGRVDHITAYIPQGFTPEVRRLLETPGHLIVNREGSFEMTPAPIASGLLGPSRAWVSVTPFLGPRHPWKDREHKGAPVRPKGGRGAAEQLEYELARLRGTGLSRLPNAKIRSMPPDDMVPPSRFRIERRRPGTPTNPVGGYFFVEFDEPVQGLLSVGLASHFGLGQFRPLWSVQRFAGRASGPCESPEGG